MEFLNPHNTLKCPMTNICSPTWKVFVSSFQLFTAFFFWLDFFLPNKSTRSVVH